MAQGTITRKDIITDEALTWGKDYVANLEGAINKNKEFVQAILALNDANNGLKLAQTQKELEAATKKANIEGERALTVWKEQNQLELALISTKKKNILATESTNQALIKERVELQATNKVMKQAALEQLGMVSAYTKLNNARTEAKNKLRDLLVAEDKNTKAIKAAQKEYEVLDAKVRKADMAVGDFSKNVGNYPFQNATAGLKNLIGAFGVTTGIALFAGIMKGAYDTIKKFEQGVADLSAITGASGKDLDFLKNKAIELGKGVEGGAIAVVEAYKLIASAKPELLDNVDALNQVTEATITLSQAAGMQLPEAATALTDALNQFNMPADQAGAFIDTLANGAKYGAAEIPQITEALLKFGAVARNSNINIKESTALIELLAENGLKGADAGTALRNVLLKISAPDALPLKAKEAIQDLGISFETLKDKTVPIQQKLELLKPILNDNAKLVKVFGLENVVAAQNIISHTDRLKELTSKMGEFGTAEEQAKKRMDTLNGRVIQLGSAYDSFVLSVDSGSGIISKSFKKIVESGIGILQVLERINSSWDDLYNKAKGRGRATGQDTFDRLMSGKNGADAVKEAEANVRITKNAIASVQDELEKTKKQLASINPYAVKLFPTGPSPRDLKLKIEKLKETSAEYEKLYTLSRDFVNNSKKPVANVGGTTVTGGGVTVDQTNQEKEAKLAKEKKFTDDYLKILKDRLDSENKLNQFRYDREIYYNELILNDDKQSIEERSNAYLQIQQVREASAKDGLENELQNMAIARIEEKKRELETLGGEERITKAKAEEMFKRSQEEIKATLQTGALRKGATDAEILAYQKYLLELKKLDDKAKKEKQDLIDSQVAVLQKSLDAQNQSTDTAMNDSITKENKLFKNALDVAQGNFDLIEQATAEHEQRLYNITAESNKKKLQLQVDTMQKLLDDNAKLPKEAQISAEKRAEIENKLSAYKKQISEIDVQTATKSNEEILATNKDRAERAIQLEQEQHDRTKELAENLASSLIDLTNAIFDAKIASIDAEIQAVNTSYDEQIKSAGNNAAQKDLLEKEKEKKTKALEKERKKELIKAAIFNKVISLAQIGLDLAKTMMAINLAAAEMDALAAYGFGAAGGVYRGIQIPLAIGTAAAQAAVVLATPLPKYKYGRKGGPAELAWTGDGGVNEVLSNPDGSNPIVTPNKPTLTKLNKDQMVHKSIGAYEEYVKRSILSGISVDNRRMGDYVNSNSSAYSAELLEELKRNTKAIEKQKLNVNVSSRKTDINYHLWKMSNTNWNRR
jgi:TP901 family phage tail tape measure protein